MNRFAKRGSALILMAVVGSVLVPSAQAGGWLRGRGAQQGGTQQQGGIVGRVSNLPRIPSIPGVKMPGIPGIPGIPGLKGIPGMPGIGSLPGLIGKLR